MEMDVETKDPICGMAVDPEKASATRWRDGETVYFCSPACARRFDEADPRTAIEEAEYEVEPDTRRGPEEVVDREEEARRREYRTLMRKFWFSALVSVPVVLLSYPWLVPWLRDVPWLARGSDGLLWVWRGLGLLTLPVLLWGGSQFYKGLWAAARSRSANMHTLIGVGIAGRGSTRRWR